MGTPSFRVSGLISGLISDADIGYIGSDPHFSNNKSDQHDASWDKLNPNPLWPPSAPWRRLKNGLKMEDPSENTDFFHSGCLNLSQNIPYVSIQDIQGLHKIPSYPDARKSIILYHKKCHRTLPSPQNFLPLVLKLFSNRNMAR